MKRLFFALVLFAAGYFCALFITQAIADGTYLSEQDIYNLVYNSSTTSLDIRGQ